MWMVEFECEVYRVGDNDGVWRLVHKDDAIMPYIDIDAEPIEINLIGTQLRMKALLKHFF